MRIIIYFCLYSMLTFSISSAADVYQWVDSKGRTHFSDTPPDNSLTTKMMSSEDLQNSINSSDQGKKDQSIESLNQISKRMKRERLSREQETRRASKEKQRKYLKNERRLAKKEKKKRDCAAARRKQNLAFRQRTTRKSLSGMRRSLANYEQKKAIRDRVCK